MRGEPRRVRTAVAAGGRNAEKVAVTPFEVLSVTVQVVFVPVHAPPQPRNLTPVPGIAVSTTLVPAEKRWTQVFFGPLPMHFPAEELTVPRPVTPIVSFVAGAAPKVAETLFAAVIVSVHVVEVPLHAPPQPVNVAPETRVAVKVTLAFTVTFALHVVPPLPQLIPPPVTLPLPVTVTVNATVELVPLENVAVTVFALVIETVHVGVMPLQAPPQPVNVAPDPGVAVRVTLALSV